jgi:hypothetical protein
VQKLIITKISQFLFTKLIVVCYIFYFDEVLEVLELRAYKARALFLSSFFAIKCFSFYSCFTGNCIFCSKVKMLIVLCSRNHVVSSPKVEYKSEHSLLISIQDTQ